MEAVFPLILWFRAFSKPSYSLLWKVHDLTHPFSTKTTAILTFKQKRVIQNQSQHITSLPLLSPTKTKTPKNIYCQAWSTNNYLLWLVSLLALKNDNTHSLHDKPLFFWDATSHTNKHNNTPHAASIEPHLLISKPLTAPSSQKDMRCPKHQTKQVVAQQAR